MGTCAVASTTAAGLDFGSSRLQGLPSWHSAKLHLLSATLHPERPKPVPYQGNGIGSGS